MDRFAADRSAMVREQIQRRGFRDPRLLSAFERVPRHVFVPPGIRYMSYDDGPLPIGHNQTISQPYIVALMTDLAGLHGGEKVLEIGTGSGYQAAILGCMAGEVHSVERIPELADHAARLLRHLGYANICVHQADGTLGWLESAPYAAILVTAAAPSIPGPLLEQLADSGCLILPLHENAGYQMLTRVRMQRGKPQQEAIASVAFVPLVGRFGWS